MDTGTRQTPGRRKSRNPTPCDESAWDQHLQKIIDCGRCTRLRKHCVAIAKEKRRAFVQDVYWGRPVPPFGAPTARLVIVGLAPAAHGANRTGRMFTGDRSGDWLYRALHRAGFANQPNSSHSQDGLILRDAVVTASARCAPPDNKPTPKELSACHPYLEWELRFFQNAVVYLALGKLAWDQTWKTLCSIAQTERVKTPKFAHGAEASLENLAGFKNRWLVGSYHPSQQNTFTGRLTEEMFDAVFRSVRAKISIY